MNIVILISGNGSNLQAIIDYFAKPKSNVTITAVISNRPEANGLTRATTAGIPSQTIIYKDDSSRADTDHKLSQIIDHYKPDLVVLAGFMRILSNDFVGRYTGRLINIHPSLLPKYKGLSTHKRVLETGDLEHGTTVHYVSAELDDGPIIAQTKLTLNKSETETSLTQRIHTLEHKLYPYVIELIATNRISLAKDVVLFDGNPLAKSGIMLNL